jgi:hypothetical protein
MLVFMAGIPGPGEVSLVPACLETWPIYKFVAIRWDIQLKVA